MAAELQELVEDAERRTREDLLPDREDPPLEIGARRYRGSRAGVRVLDECQQGLAIHLAVRRER
jgi:hypothetical protein